MPSYSVLYLIEDILYFPYFIMDSIKRSTREEGDKTPDSSFTTSVVSRPVEKRVRDFPAKKKSKSSSSREVPQQQTSQQVASSRLLDDPQTNPPFSSELVDTDSDSVIQSRRIRKRSPEADSPVGSDPADEDSQGGESRDLRDHRDPPPAAHQADGYRDSSDRIPSTPQVMPATITVNRDYVTLNDLISPEEATAFLAQAKVPGFEAGIFNLSQLIFTTAQNHVSIRLNHARKVWERVLPGKSYDLHLDWLNRLTVLEAATLIFHLFGPEQASTTEQVVSLDSQLRAHDWGWLMSDPTVEDKIFCSILELVTRVEPAASTERLRELAKILISRLPLDCHQTTIFKQQTALLSPHCLLTETPRSVCLRLKNILYEARQIVHEAAVFMTPSDGAIKVNASGKLIPRGVAKQVVKPAPKTLSQGRMDRCNTCRVFGHVTANCKQSHLPGCNRTTIPWAQSHMGKAWKAIGLERVTEGINCPSSSSSSGAVSSTTPYVPRAPAAANRQNGKFDTAFVSAISPSDHSPNDFLTVSISLQSQTTRLAAEAANRVVVVEGAGIKTSAEALLDTGALMGNYINTRVVDALKADNYVYYAKTPISVCSGLDNVCYTTNKMLDILVTYVHEITKSKISISLNTFIS